MSVTVQIYKFSSPQVVNNESLLTRVLNRGYDLPRFKYNVITTPRIKNSLVEDLGVSPLQDSYVFFCIANDEPTEDKHIGCDEPLDDYEQTTEKLKLRYPHIAVNDVQRCYDNSVDQTRSDLPLPKPLEDRLLSMAALKPHHTESGQAFEVTGFVSFYKGAGSLVIREAEQFAAKFLGASQIWVTAIKEHQLREMYEKWGYNFVEHIYVPLASNGEVDNSGSSLENDIGATRPFYLEVMMKSV